MRIAHGAGYWSEMLGYSRIKPTRGPFRPRFNDRLSCGTLHGKAIDRQLQKTKR